MKIAFVTHKYGGSSGGIERVVEELSKRFALEHEVHVYTQTIPRETRSTIRFYKIPSFRNSWSINLILYFFLSRLALLGKEYDIVHLHAPSLYRNGIVTCHGIPRSGLLALQRANTDVKQEISLQHTRRFRYMRFVLEYNFRKNNHKRVIAISSNIYRDLISICRTPAKNITLIPNGVDIDRFTSISRQQARSWIENEFGLRREHFLYLFVGNFFKRKGLAFLLRSFVSLKIPEARLIVCGNTMEGNHWAIDRVSQMGLKDKIIFVGKRSDMEKFYAGSDVMVFPTLYEAFPLVLLEAQASGLPVIASRTGGTEDFIRDGENGFLLSDCNNIDDLKEKMKILQRNPIRCRQMGENGKRVIKNYSWDRIVEHTLQLYRETALYSVTKK